MIQQFNFLTSTLRAQIRKDIHIPKYWSTIQNSNWDNPSIQEEMSEQRNYECTTSFKKDEIIKSEAKRMYLKIIRVKLEGTGNIGNTTPYADYKET